MYELFSYEIFDFADERNPTYTLDQVRNGDCSNSTMISSPRLASETLLTCYPNIELIWPSNEPHYQFKFEIGDMHSSWEASLSMDSAGWFTAFELALYTDELVETKVFDGYVNSIYAYNFNITTYVNEFTTFEYVPERYIELTNSELVTPTDCSFTFTCISLNCSDSVTYDDFTVTVKNMTQSEVGN